MLKYKYIFQIKYTEAILSNSTRKLLWFKNYENADCSLKNKFIHCVICYKSRHTFDPYSLPLIAVPPRIENSNSTLYASDYSVAQRR